MTSNITPYGSASASSIYSAGYPAYYAFDNNPSTAWVPINTVTPQWIQYQFTSSVVVTQWEFYNIGSSGTGVWSLQSSNNAIGWTTLDTHTIAPDATQRTGSFSFSNSIPYVYYRMYFTNTTGGSPAIYFLKLYGY